jgi:hypothetical protein
MNGFAIVSEGVTDYAVLKNILLGWFKGQPAEPFLKPYQPDPTAEGESSWQQFGNWENVFRYLHEKKHRDALEYAEYLIVQIDTDVSELPNFGVDQHANGKPLEPEIMVERVADKLRAMIGSKDIEFYGDRIIFAICVREIECWLLPLWDPRKAMKCEGCTSAVDRALLAANELQLDKKQERYAAASKDYRKRRTLIDEGRKNPSLRIFLDELERRDITLSDD